jgi:hypothetical protein
MSEPMTKSQLLDDIQRAYAEWETSLAQLDDESMLRAGLCGSWSGKDVLAHITWFEREMVGMLNAHALEGSDLWDLPVDERNQAIFERSKKRSLQDVRDEARLVHSSLLQALNLLAEDDMDNPGHFPWMPADWQPWKIIASNTSEHYLDHLQQVKAWLGNNKV